MPVPKVIEVTKTSPVGKYVVRILHPFTNKGKDLTKEEARDLAVAWFNRFRHLGVKSVIRYV